ncbi:SDR family oxidoreductase [Curtobacterium sp. VKM Ac-2922]|uniref:SDR family oxidoreductase n=1 Tax=Curtobacterium sp. VKM Ac-2922 TaxID=2929475 RepID=UPI001FB3576E|nr:SDR family oxidoreductase [Curtobacterium sp. VKM Ac-2922]MCJ1714992.1 SDR family oxidoreductase [Curtobacterium sp. VKM Ac-2922]
MTIAITGATGNIGGAVARALAADGVPFRMIVRDAARAPELPGTEVRTATFADAEASRAALEGVDVLLMVSGAEAQDRLQQHRTFVGAAATAGVRHVVYTSFSGAAADATFTLGRDHWATEQAVRATGMAHTFLRDNFYLDFVEDLVGEDGVIRGPAGDGAMAAVARADVARVATTVLANPTAHLDRTYELTGPVAITLEQAAATVSAERGRAVTYHRETLDEAYASRAQWDPEPWQADAWVSTYTAIAEGALARVSGDVERVTGRPPMTLQDVLRAG